MASALIDASVLVALFGHKQPKQQHYLELMQLAELEHWSLATTWPCVVEACYLVTPPERYSLMTWIGKRAVTIFPFDQEALLDFIPAMTLYTQKPRTEMDLADASLYALANETGVTTIMTTDIRDFSRYRLPDGRGFDIL